MAMLKSVAVSGLAGLGYKEILLINNVWRYNKEKLWIAVQTFIVSFFFGSAMHNRLVYAL